jgi:hypothetical protein
VNGVALKSAVVAVFGSPAGFTGLQQLHNCGDRTQGRLVRWLDESGMALYFLAELESSNRSDVIPESMLRELMQRREKNRVRMREMFCELTRVNAALAASGAQYALIKGFSLAPEFCPGIALRHQSDVDILACPADAESARDAVIPCGYTVEETIPDGEIRLVGPLFHLPTKHDDVYAVQFQRRAEIHVGIFEPTQGVEIAAPADCLSRVERKRIDGETFPVLCLADRFLLQCLHAFRHIIGSWGRLSWLYEISYFLKQSESNSGLWQQVSARLSNRELKTVCGLVLLLAKKLFDSPIPAELAHCCEGDGFQRVEAWVNEFGTEWALTGMEGSKASLFLHREFIHDRRLRNHWLRVRLLPVERRPMLAYTRPVGIRYGFAELKKQGLRYAERAAFHGSALIKFASHWLRWRRALQDRKSAT